MEEELGCKLFVRKRHSVELTPEGLELRSRAIEALQIVEHIEHDFASRGDQEISGSVFIAAAETAGTLDLVRNAAAVIAASGELSLTFDSIGGYMGDGLVFRPLSPILQTGSFAAWKRGRTFSDAARLFIDTLKEELVAREEPPKPHPVTHAGTSDPANAHERCCLGSGDKGGGTEGAGQRGGGV